MCLIIHKPAGSPFNPALFSVIKFHNPHGFGLMYPDGGTIRAKKGLMSILKILEFWDEYKDQHLAIHFRYATEGTVTPENCHPFRVLSKEKHGRDLYMMHNGTIKAVPIKDKGRSDTFHFVTNYLAPLLQDQADLIDNEKFQEFVGGMIGQSKLLFMDGDGKVIIINRELGSTRGDVWVSNQYSLKYPRPDTRRGAKAAAKRGTGTGTTTTVNGVTTTTYGPAPATTIGAAAAPVTHTPHAWQRNVAANPESVPPRQADLLTSTAVTPPAPIGEDSGRQLERILPRSVPTPVSVRPFVPNEV